jgi:dehydrogenase/reductase SDR family member 7B
MFNNQCWWITGASSGIGEGLAQKLADQGARLILSGRNVGELERVASVCGADRCLILPFDVTDFAALAALVNQAWGWAGRIDALVNNAGISQRSLALESAFKVYEEITKVDLLAPIALTQALLPKMVAAGGGRIVAISSVAGIVGVPMRSAYCAAKHGLIGYCDSLRCETAHLGIQVQVIAPGSIKTNVSRNALTADGSARGVSDGVIEAGYSVDEAVDAMMGALTAGKREFIFARGAEAQIAALRRSDPDGLFDQMEKMVRAGYAEKMKSAKPA